ncbi:MAG: type transport system permease protein [Solirubrobacteraceae bacterium]|nr:type transport system permease protein [Solirubrobacteraceae bacterium]
MSTTTLAMPIRVDAARASTRPGLGRLVAVELRKMVDTRAGFWLLAAVVVTTVVAVVARALVGDAADHDFASMMLVALQPAAVMLPIVGILLVTSEWSQRTGQITFTLTPLRSRVLVAKLLASVVLGVASLLLSLAVAAPATALAGAGLDGAWSYSPALLGQAAVYLVTGMITGVAIGAALLASAPAIVVYFTAPFALTAIVSLSLFAGVAPWVDTVRATGPMVEEVLSATQWAHAGTALALWMVLPLLIGAYRITRRELSA